MKIADIDTLCRTFDLPAALGIPVVAEGASPGKTLMKCELRSYGLKHIMLGDFGTSEAEVGEVVARLVDGARTFTKEATKLNSAELECRDLNEIYPHINDGQKEAHIVLRLTAWMKEPPVQIDWDRHQKVRRFLSSAIDGQNAKMALLLGDYDEGQRDLVEELEWGRHAFTPGNERAAISILRYVETRSQLDWCSVKTPVADVAREVERLISSLLERAKLDSGDHGLKCLLFSHFSDKDSFVITLKAVPNS